MEKGLLIGMDGGGTRTTAVAVSPEGQVLARVVGEGLNFNNIGIARTRENFQGMIRALLSKCKEKDFSCLTAGVSALDDTADAETKKKLLNGTFAEEKIDLESDAYIALMGVTLGEPGAIVICGTGSMLLLVDEKGEHHVSGGWGRLLGDAGSAYTIAMEALQACVYAWDGAGPETALCQAAMSCFSLETPRELIRRFYTPDIEPYKIALFARDVLNAAGKDAVAGQIVKSNMERLAAQTAALLRGHWEVHTVGIYGGVFQHNPWVVAQYRQLLEKAVPGVCLQAPRYPPEIGAVLHCFKKQGKLTEKVLENLAKDGISAV